MLYVYFLQRNTALQCLIHCDFFIESLFSEIDKRCIANGLCTELKELVQKMRSNGNLAVSPSLLRSAIISKHRKFANYSQHDSQELLRLVLETISIELSRCAKNTAYKEFNSISSSKLEINKEFHCHYLKREDSIVLDYFYGQYCNTFTCSKCNYQTYSFEKFLDIPVYICYLLKKQRF